MAGGEGFNLKEAFATADFHEARLEERFRRTMETLAQHPGKPIWASSANRAEAKAIYHLLGNEKASREAIISAHRAQTIRRMEGYPVIGKAYSIKEAVDYIGWIRGPKRAPSDGPPGVKTIWIGLQKFYTLFEYRDMFNFVGQV